MNVVDAIMQYAVYVMLTICGACLVGALAVFIGLERPWQQRVEVEAEEAISRVQSYGLRAKEMVEEERQRERAILAELEEMQIVAHEDDRAPPFKNVA